MPVPRSRRRAAPGYPRGRAVNRRGVVCGRITNAFMACGSGSATSSDRVGMPSTTTATMHGVVPETQSTEQGRTYSTPRTASAARMMTSSRGAMGAAQASSKAAAHTWRTSTRTILPSPINCAAIALLGRAHVPGEGIRRSLVTSCISESSSSCSCDVRGSPSVAWRARNSQKRTRNPSLSITVVSRGCPARTLSGTPGVRLGSCSGYATAAAPPSVPAARSGKSKRT
jgi:hypothetical protein